MSSKVFVLGITLLLFFPDVYGLMFIVLRLFREPLTHTDGIITGLGLPKKKDRCSLLTAFEQDGTTAAVIQGLGFLWSHQNDRPILTLLTTSNGF